MILTIKSESNPEKVVELSLYILRPNFFQLKANGQTIVQGPLGDPKGYGNIMVYTEIIKGIFDLNTVEINGGGTGQLADNYGNY